MCVCVEREREREREEGSGAGGVSRGVEGCRGSSARKQERQKARAPAHHGMRPPVCCVREEETERERPEDAQASVA